MPTGGQEKPESPVQSIDALVYDLEDGCNTAGLLPAESSKHPLPARKKLIRRDDRDYSQPLRLAVQILFACLNAWIGVQFYLWVRWAVTGLYMSVILPCAIEMVPTWEQWS